VSETLGDEETDLVESDEEEEEERTINL